MPARFTAYAIGPIDSLIETTDPTGPQWEGDRAVWKVELLA